MKKIVFAVLIGIILLIFGLHLKKINATVSRIDQLQQVLDQIKPYLVNKTYVSVIADSTDESLFFQIQFVLAPTIIEMEETNTDTIIIIENIKEKKNDFLNNNYSILSSNRSENYQVFLCSKK